MLRARSAENCKTGVLSYLTFLLPRDTPRPASSPDPAGAEGARDRPLRDPPREARETGWLRQPCPCALPKPSVCAAPARLVRQLPSRVRSRAPQRRGEQRDPAPPAPPRPRPGPRGPPRT